MLIKEKLGSFAEDGYEMGLCIKHKRSLISTVNTIHLNRETLFFVNYFLN
jgi:hypothetical protein